MNEGFPKFDWKMNPDNMGAVLTVTPKPYEEVRKRVEEQLRRDEEDKVKLALIELGWIPPRDALP